MGLEWAPFWLEFTLGGLGSMGWQWLEEACRGKTEQNAASSPNAWGCRDPLPDKVQACWQRDSHLGRSRLIRNRVQWVFATAINSIKHSASMFEHPYDLHNASWCPQTPICFLTLFWGCTVKMALQLISTIFVISSYF